MCAFICLQVWAGVCFRKPSTVLNQIPKKKGGELERLGESKGEKSAICKKIPLLLWDDNICLSDTSLQICGHASCLTLFGHFSWLCGSLLLVTLHRKALAHRVFGSEKEPSWKLERVRGSSGGEGRAKCRPNTDVYCARIYLEESIGPFGPGFTLMSSRWPSLIVVPLIPPKIEMSNIFWGCASKGSPKGPLQADQQVLQGPGMKP